MKEQESKKRKNGRTLHLHIDNELRQVFIGHHTLFSVFGFTVGGILVGEMLARLLHDTIGLLPTLAFGFVLFIVSAFWTQEFKD